MTTLNLAQRRILGTGAILTHLNDGDPGQLGGDARPSGSESASALLRGSWSVTTESQLKDVLDTLWNAGHRAAFEREGFGPAATIAAWDLGRIASVVGWGYLAYLCDREGAWAWMKTATAMAQHTFSSWEAFGESYARGRVFWIERRKKALAEADAVDDDPVDPHEVAAAVRALLSPTGPWHSVPWNQPLEDVAAPPEQRTILRAVPGTLAQVLASAPADARVMLAEGTYRQSLKLARSCELVADGSGVVILEGTRSPTVHVEEGGVLLHGIAVRAPLRPGDEAADAVHSESGYLRIERCHVSAGRHGIDLLSGASEVSIADSTVQGCGSVGVIVESGYLAMQRSTVTASASIGVQVGGEAEARVEGTRIHGGGMGVAVQGEAELSLVDCEVFDHADVTLQVSDDARVRVERSSLHHGRGAGALVTDRAGLFFTGCHLHDHAFCGIEARGAVTLAVLSCKISGETEGGIWLHEGASGRIEDTDVRGTTRIALQIGRRARGLATGCTFAGSREGGGVWVQDGGTGGASKCTIEDNDAAAIEVTGKGSSFQVVDSTVRGGGGDGALITDGGTLSLAGTTISAMKATGVRCEGGTVHMMHGAIDGAGSSGVLVKDGARARFERVAIRNNTLHGIEITNACPDVIDCVVTANHETGICVYEGGGARITGTEISSSGDAGLHVSAKNVTAVRCRMTNNGSSGVFVGEGGEVEMEECTLETNGNVGVEACEDARIRLVRSRIARNADDDVFAYESARCTIEDCEVIGGAGRTLVAEGKGQIRVVRSRVSPGDKGEVARIDGGTVSVDERSH